MSEKLFTPEEIIALKENPYVYRVTARMISFTAEFKERFLAEYERGKTPASIITGAGIDPQVLGNSRITGILLHVKDQAKRAERFENKRTYQPSSISGNRAMTANQKIVKLEHQLAYTRQELEFLKKIILADREAQRVWVSKQRPESSSDSSKK